MRRHCPGAGTGGVGPRSARRPVGGVIGWAEASFGSPCMVNAPRAGVARVGQIPGVLPAGQAGTPPV